MDASRRLGAACGIWLILAGVLLLAVLWIPALALWMVRHNWLTLATGAAAGLTVLVALLCGLPRLAIPAIILGGVAALFHYEAGSGHAGAWAYLWTAIIGLAGVGLLVAGLFELQFDQMRSGVALMVLSAVLYSLFGTWLGGLDLLNPRWVFVMLMAVLFLLLRPMVRGA